MIQLINPSAYAITLGTEVDAPANTATTLSVAGTYYMSYKCIDGTNVSISFVAVV